MNKKTNEVAFYAKNEEGTVDELILDLFEREFEYKGHLDERDLRKKHGGTGREFELKHAELKHLFEIVANAFCYHGSTYIEAQSYEERQAENRLWAQWKRRRKLVPKEHVWQAIKWEWSEVDLNDLCSYEKYRYEKDDYYDFSLIMDKIHAFMAGECSVWYFASWLILMMRCLQESTICTNRLQKEIYNEIAGLFDGEAFMSSDISEEKKRMDCSELIAHLKDFNHRLKCIETQKDAPFTKNGVITYVAFVACIEESTIDLRKVCVVDKKRRTLNCLFVPNLIYREEVNYTFLSEAEFDLLTSIYYEYTLDETMKEDYAMTKSNHR